MHILKLTYTIVTISGCFRPQSWTSLFKRTVYNIYRLYVIIMLYTFTIFQIMDLVLYVDNTNDFTNNMNMMLTVSISCYKVLIMCLNYENIVALINYLTEEPFKPLDSDEMKIRRRYDKLIRNNTLRYTVLVTATCIIVISSSLFTDFRHKRLKYREWIPYDYSSYKIFCFTYAQQLLSACYSGIVSVAIDSLVCGLFMHICCQIEILEYRLRKILSNQLTVAYCVRHHNRIFEFAQLVNINFTKIIGFQFTASVMITCTNLYQLTKSTFNADHFSLITFTGAMLTQIFIYCWFGNKVKLKVYLIEQKLRSDKYNILRITSQSLQLTDSIFQMEWPKMNNNVKKSLLIIMKRAMTPIEISSLYILTMNLDSFVSVSIKIFILMYL
ncbi:odorant receptor 46a-like isoform X2 [Temnothorax americanus]|uniref:odorant receptor 46a-like isoform X2 n=1 Tax=Temnothorax americanus TaxID=1964332 RepID=UPI0040686205